MTPQSHYALRIPSFVKNCERSLRRLKKEESERLVKANMKTSKLEEEVAKQIAASNLPEPEREYQFHPTRKFRFDFAWAREKVALEVQGGTWIGGRHTTGAGLSKEYEKSNLAQIANWTVLQVTTDDVKHGRVVPLLEQVL